MFSKDPTWLAQLSSMTADLTSQQPPVKQAPMLTVAIVLSLETACCGQGESPFLQGPVVGSSAYGFTEGRRPARHTTFIDVPYGLWV